MRSLESGERGFAERRALQICNRSRGDRRRKLSAAMKRLIAQRT